MILFIFDVISKERKKKNTKQLAFSTAHSNRFLVFFV